MPCAERKNSRKKLNNTLHWSIIGVSDRRGFSGQNSEDRELAGWTLDPQRSTQFGTSHGTCTLASSEMRDVEVGTDWLVGSGPFMVDMQWTALGAAERAWRS